MKKFFTFLMLIPVFSVSVAQVKTVYTKPTKTNEVETLKTPAPNTVPVKLPDLHTTAATVMATSTSPGAYKLTIQCTVKNEGNVAISLDKIDLQGWIAAESKLDLPLTSTEYQIACGAAAGLPGKTLEPGASVTQTYYCFNRVLSPADKPVYVLMLNPEYRIKELNKDNNRTNVSITFN
jgi:hypothetical protein